MLYINLREKTSQKYKAVQVSYFDPKKKKTVKATARNENVAKGDTLKITARCSDRKQAIVKAKAALGTADDKIEGSLEFSGNPYLIAGTNIELKGIGHFSGKYHIKQARHVIDRSSGYKTYSRALRFGIVSQINPVSAQARVSFQDDESTSYWLPVLQTKTFKDKFYAMPDIGEQVACLMDENSEDGVILGAIYSTEDVPVVYI